MTTNTRVSGFSLMLWFAQNSLPLWLKWQLLHDTSLQDSCCDLLKIHYLCGWNDNVQMHAVPDSLVVICSKFITFVVEMTTLKPLRRGTKPLWFAQNSLPLWLKWQRVSRSHRCCSCCDLLKIHYLCGWNDNEGTIFPFHLLVVICSKFITFVVEMTTAHSYHDNTMTLWFAQNSLPLWLKWQHKFYIRLCIR